MMNKVDNGFLDYLGVFLILAFSLLMIPSALTFAAEKNVVSENLIHLQDNGKAYILHRTMRSNWPAYEFHIDKSTALDQFYYISPNEFKWDDETHSATNTLNFSQGDFVVMYPGEFSTEVTVDESGVYTFESWDGTTQDDGLFGFWNKPGDFSSFAYVWIFPADLELISYESNRDGEWTERNNTVAYFGEDVNSLTFKIKYRKRDQDSDGVVDRRDQCPDTKAGAKVAEFGCELDSDGDGVVDSQDQCPQTPSDVKVSESGCELDSDGDGVADSQDQCPQTPAGAKVAESGCELDSDGDGVADSLDQCPQTSAEAKVAESGCELDSDVDGVVDSQDQCPQTPTGAKVAESGCELDGDGDGVVDSRDQCPQTMAGSKVAESGCELDSDGDGVVDSKDQCPQTMAGVKVAESGCELDSDGDGVVDSQDQCPQTLAGAEVAESGCELDSDGDGVADSQDRCPQTFPGAKVSESGCELDSDGDGVVDSQDQCPQTPAGAKVAESGCELDSDGDGVVDSLDQCPKSPEGAEVGSTGCQPDSDGDGVTDKLDLCPNTVQETKVDVTGCASDKTITLHGVRFLFSSDELNQESTEVLDQIVAILKQYPHLRLQVAGHTDSVGEAVFNLNLSQRRAESVREFLINESGMSPDNISAVGYGEENPVADNSTPDATIVKVVVQFSKLLRL